MRNEFGGRVMRNQFGGCVMRTRRANSPPKLGGEDASSKRCREASEAGADGVVCSTSRSFLIDGREAVLIRCASRIFIRRLRDFEQTTPALRAAPPNGFAQRIGKVGQTTN